MKKLIIIFCLIGIALPMLLGCGAVKYDVIAPARVCASEIKDEISDISKQITRDITEEIKDTDYYLNPDDLDKLEDLRIDNYRELTVDEYVDEIEQLFDISEYVKLSDKYLNGSQIIAGLRTGDDLARYFYYVLGPLVSANDYKRGFGDYLIKDADNGKVRLCLEYDAYIEVLEPEILTVGEYEQTMDKVKEKIREVFDESELPSNKEFYEHRDSYENLAEEKIKNIIAELSDDKLRVYIDYVIYIDEDEEMFYYDYDYDYSCYDYAYDYDYNYNKERYCEEAEKRRAMPTVKNDYKSLLALMDDGYKQMPLAEFNEKLLEWANEDVERAWRIDEDLMCGELDCLDFSEKELDFIKITVDLSGTENGKYLEYLRDGVERRPYRRVRLENGEPYAYLECVFSYEIEDLNVVTVGERDSAVENAAQEIEDYWFSLTAKDFSTLSENELKVNLEDIVSGCGTKNIKLFVDSVFFDTAE